MKKYKKSKYNFVVKLDADDTYVMTNFITGNIAKLNAWHMFLYENIGINDIDEKTKKIYIDNGFFVEDDFDEISYIKKRLKANIYSNDEVYLTICTTFYCNLSCVYCFEGQDKENIKMSIDTEKKTIEFIEKLVKESKTKVLRIWWYGGEPLLNAYTIEHMSKNILCIVDKYNLKYVARIITNGTLLNQKICDMLEASGISEAQITIDGAISDIHDKTRPFKDGRGSYDIIVENLSSIKTKIKIDILFVLTKNNKDNTKSMELFVEELKRKTGNKLNLVISDLLENEENVEHVNSLMLATEEKIDTINSIKNKKEDKDIYEVCSAQKYYSYIVDARGNLTKCTDNFKKKEDIICNVSDDDIDEKIKTSPASLEFINSIWVQDDGPCDDCEFFAYCVGRCPVSRKKSKCDKNELRKRLEYIIKSNINGLSLN